MGRGVNEGECCREGTTSATLRGGKSCLLTQQSREQARPGCAYMCAYICGY